MPKRPWTLGAGLLLAAALTACAGDGPGWGGPPAPAGVAVIQPPPPYGADPAMDARLDRVARRLPGMIERQERGWWGGGDAPAPPRPWPFPFNGANGRQPEQSSQ
ncbi:MAG: hypothetical protein K2X11_06685 [Acetobacteraceae bacterium]|nr:hypothetical protein [Acetobacteraceae bacterium]